MSHQSCDFGPENFGPLVPRDERRNGWIEGTLYTAKRENMVLYNSTGTSEIQPDPVANVLYRIF